jgi:hypothetical protein
MGHNLARATTVTTVAVPFLCTAVVSAQTQIRGLYTPGMNATNSGVLPDAGLTYQDLFQLYTFDELKGPTKQSLPVNATASLSWPDLRS